MLKASEQLGIDLNLLAINHWPVAVNSHTLNHPTVRHKCQDLDSIRPVDAVPGRRLHVMAASPECTHHSLAAGGRPKNDQSRATAWHVCRWASDLTIDNIFIENVAEFQFWGPLDGRGKPMKSRRGETFNAFIQALQSMNYRVEYRVQNAAAFGDPTSRKRLIIMARRNGKEIVWPEVTHGPGLEPYHTAREVIDWDMKGQSIFRRKKPLSKNTIRRIAAGLKKFGGANAQPFLVMLYGTGETRSVDRPMPTVTANGGHMALAEPFLVGVTHSKRDENCHSVDKPLPTITTAKGGEYAMVQPFLLQFNEGDERRAHSVDKPLPVQTTCNRFALCEPFVLPHPGNGDNPQSVDKPLRTITATSSDMMLVQPFLIGVGGPAYSAKPKSVDEPMNTVMCENHTAVVQPFITHLTHPGGNDASRCHSAEDPLPTVTGAHRGELALVEPFVMKYYGTGVCASVEEPLDTITARDRFLLVEPKTGRAVAEIDILLRMLQPHELAAAMSFPKDYKFYGTREQRVKQIGNAVCVELARVHMLALMGN
jgi:DNA (cytosine-5)-methyltransferase 1